MFNEKYFHHNFRLGKIYLQNLQTFCIFYKDFLWIGIFVFNIFLVETLQKKNLVKFLFLFNYLIIKRSQIHVFSCLKILVCLVCISSGCIDAIDHIEIANAI